MSELQRAPALSDPGPTQPERDTGVAIGGEMWAILGRFGWDLDCRMEDDAVVEVVECGAMARALPRRFCDGAEWRAVGLGA